MIMFIRKKKLKEIINKAIDENIEHMEGMKFLKGGFKINQDGLKSRLLQETGIEYGVYHRRYKNDRRRKMGRM